MPVSIAGKQIEDREFEEEIESLEDHYESIGKSVCCDDEAEITAQAQENVIQRNLLLFESNARFGEVTDAEVSEHFESLKAEHGSEEAFYENTGLHRGEQPQILERIKTGIAVNRLLEAELDHSGEVSDDERLAFYESHLDQFMTAEEVRLNQLFIEPASHEQAKAVYQQIRNARHELLEGADFVEIAEANRNDKEHNIDLGFIKYGETMPEIEAIVFSMKEGEISPVIATQFGFHLFQVTEIKAQEPIPMTEIEDFDDQLISAKKNESLDRLIAELKAKMPVEGTFEKAS